MPTEAQRSTWTTLVEYAMVENDAILYQLMMAQSTHPKNWDDFIIDVVKTLSTVNKASQERLSDVISQQPRPIYISSEAAKDVPDGAWAEDYPDNCVPDGAWPR